MTTRWTVVHFEGKHEIWADTQDEASVYIGQASSKERAAQIVRDHNRAEAWEAMQEALELAESALHEAHLDYNHPMFTDRRQAGPRMTKAFNAAKAALALAGKE